MEKLEDIALENILKDEYVAAFWLDLQMEKVEVIYMDPPTSEEYAELLEGSGSYPVLMKIFQKKSIHEEDRPRAESCYDMDVIRDTLQKQPEMKWFYRVCRKNGVRVCKMKMVRRDRGGRFGALLLFKDLQNDLEDAVDFGNHLLNLAQKDELLEEERKQFVRYIARDIAGPGHTILHLIGLAEKRLARIEDADLRADYTRYFRIMRECDNVILDTILEHLKRETESDGMSLKPSFRLHGIRALLVYNEVTWKEITEEILNLEGVITETVDTMEEAIDRLTRSASGYYHVVIVDADCADFQLEKNIRRIRGLKNVSHASVPVVALTTVRSELLEHNLIENGVDICLVHPFPAPKLYEWIEQNVYLGGGDN